MEGLSTCGRLKARVAAPKERLQTPILQVWGLGGLDAWMPGCLEAWRLEARILQPWRLVGLLAGCLAGLDWLGLTGEWGVVVWMEDLGGGDWWMVVLMVVLWHARRSERSADIDMSGMACRHGLSYLQGWALSGASSAPLASFLVIWQVSFVLHLPA